MDDENGEVRLTLRLPAVMRDRLIEKGKAHGRSLNAEIVNRLEKALKAEDQFDDDFDILDYTGELDLRVQELERKMRVLWTGENH